MKKFLVVAAAAFLMMGLAGQAKADYANGDVIEVVYQASSQYEVATDIGSMTSLESSGNSALTNASYSVFGTGSSFTGTSASSLTVAFFEVASSKNSLAASGPYKSTEMNDGYPQAKTGTAASMKSLSAYYATLSGGSGQAWQNYDPNTNGGVTSSYYYLMDGNGTAVGSFGGLYLNNPNGEASFTNGDAKLALYYWAADTSESTQPPALSFDVAVSGNTLTTSVIPNTSATPIPPSVLLFGSGLLGLIGVRRKAS
jgi:hypothetical protein